MRTKSILEVLQKQLSLLRDNSKSNIPHLRNILAIQQLFAKMDHLIQKRRWKSLKHKTMSFMLAKSVAQIGRLSTQNKNLHSLWRNVSNKFAWKEFCHRCYQEEERGRRKVLLTRGQCKCHITFSWQLSKTWSRNLRPTTSCYNHINQVDISIWL